VRTLGIFVLGVTLVACASREVTYRRSLAAPHLSDFARHLPRSDFEEIAEILSHRTRQSITDIQPYTSNEVIVFTAFRGGQGEALSSHFTLEKRDGRWHVVESRDETVLE
jgi:hypothetical protein